MDTAAHRSLAYEAAAQSIVMLKHNSQYPALPLDASKLQRLAMIGPAAAATKMLQGNYFGTPPIIVSALEGITASKGGGKFAVSFAAGCSAESTNISAGNISAAVKVAQSADATVVVLGVGQTLGGQEGTDRTSIELPQPQGALVEAVAKAMRPGPPLVVLVISGELLDIDALAKNPRVGSILWQGYPSQSGGTVLAQSSAR